MLSGTLEWVSKEKVEAFEQNGRTLLKDISMGSRKSEMDEEMGGFVGGTTSMEHENELSVLLIENNLSAFCKPMQDEGYDSVELLRSFKDEEQWKIFGDAIGMKEGHLLKLKLAVGYTPPIQTSSCCVVQ